MKDCIFCQIAANKSPAEVEYSDQNVVGFWDIHAHAPVHILIIPRKHISSIEDVKEEDWPIVSQMFKAAREIAHKKNLHNNGYRLVVNYGINAGAMVDHLHLHLLGGKNLGPIA